MGFHGSPKVLNVTAGSFRSAAESEAAWRARHKWAAQRVAPLLTDLPLHPPLAGAAALWDLVCLKIALPMDGVPLGGPMPEVAGFWAAHAGALLQWRTCIVMHYQGVRLRRESVTPHSHIHGARLASKCPS